MNYELVLILIFASILRLIFIYSRSSDDHVHLWNIRLRQKVGNPFSHRVDDSLIKGRRGYPSINHYLISVFPEKYWYLIARLLNISYDLILISIAYYGSAAIFGNVYPELQFTAVFSLQAYVALIIATSPIMLPLTARMSSIGARTLGGLLVFLYLLMMAMVLVAKRYEMIALCSTLAIVIIMSSQFALQALLIGTLGLSIIYFSAAPIIVIALVAGVVIAVPKLGLRDILAFKYEHAKWYKRNAREGSPVANRYRLKDTTSLAKHLFTDIRQFIHGFFYRSSVTIFVYSCAPFLLLIFLIARSGSIRGVYDVSVTSYAFNITIIYFIAFVLTSLRSFKYLGQAERYFEYSLPYIAYLYVLVVAIYLRSERWLLYMVIYQAVLSMINYLVMNREGLLSRLKGAEDKEYTDLVEALNAYKDLRIMTIPAKLAFRISYHSTSKHQYYYRSINERGEGRGFRYLDEDWVSFEMPRPDVKYFAEKYLVDTVVVSKEALANARKKQVDYDFSSMDVIFDNDEFVVYRANVMGGK